MAAARYRDRHSVSRKKSDPGDALVLANILRTDMHAHRPLPQDSELARAITVLARAQQDPVWNRQQIANQLRSLLREYYPAALAAVESWKRGLCRPEARALLRLASTPTQAVKLTRTQLQAALRRSAAVNVASLKKLTGSVAFSEPSGLINPTSSKSPSAGRCLPYCFSWKPLAKLPTTSKKQWPKRSLATQMLKSSSASPASAFSSAPGSWPRSETTADASQTLVV